jgi:formylglycine-generating enzyme required for sulfatase activity
VLEEAGYGRDKDLLVPLLFETVTPPFSFRSIPCIGFQTWHGEPSSSEFEQLVEAVVAKIGQPKHAAAPKATSAPRPAGATILRTGAPPAQAPGHESPRPAAMAAPKEAERKPFSAIADPLRDGGAGPLLVLLPAGVFRMGDPSGLGLANERPVHEVHIQQPFYLGRTAVTFDEYTRFAQAKGVKLPGDMGFGRGTRPVINVSWEDAQAYCGWLSEQTGQPYRLPSESEWEYAARAGTTSAYWWGFEAWQNRANFDGSGSQWSGSQTAPVGSFEASPWCLHDMSGNVWEWVQDRWHGDYTDAPLDGSAWEDGAAPTRVLRGGSWFADARCARSCSRADFHPVARYFDIGFRVACALPMAGR